MSVAMLAAVSKSFGGVRALDRVDLSVDEGERLAVLGPNGAGKTTALNIVLGLRRPDAGTVSLFGLPPSDLAARRLVGCTPQELSFPMTLRVREVVDFVRAHYPAAATFESIDECFALGELAHRQMGGLSGGEKRRVACALAFAGDPLLVVLDEPSAGLDVEARLRLWKNLELSAKTIMLTTHSFEEAETFATRVVILHRGRIHACEGDVRGAYLAVTG